MRKVHNEYLGKLKRMNKLVCKMVVRKFIGKEYKNGSSFNLTDKDDDFSASLHLCFKIGNLIGLVFIHGYEYDFSDSYEKRFYFNCVGGQRIFIFKNTELTGLTGLHDGELTFMKNIKDNLHNYLLETLKFMFDTDYIDNLPKAYTFLLSNYKNKIFPKEIAKLIAKKLLFASLYLDPLGSK